MAGTCQNLGYIFVNRSPYFWSYFLRFFGFSYFWVCFQWCGDYGDYICEEKIIFYSNFLLHEHEQRCRFRYPVFLGLINPLYLPYFWGSFGTCLRHVPTTSYMGVPLPGIVPLKKLNIKNGNICSYDAPKLFKIRFIDNPYTLTSHMIQNIL